MPTCSPNRRWIGLHRSTCFVAGFLLLVAVCLVVPGLGSSNSAIGDFADGGSVCATWNNFTHGWPWIFLNRTDYDAPPLSKNFETPVPWLTPQCWLLLGGEKLEVQPSALAGDML